MAGRKVVVYYAWSRPGEIEAPLGVIENRFPTLFESRRMAIRYMTNWPIRSDST
jgi:hypothetical protein